MLYKLLISKAQRLKTYIPGNNIIYLACALVGFLSGLAAIVLKWLVHFIHSNVYNSLGAGLSFYYILMPFAGIVLTAFLIKYLFKRHIGRGIGHILYEIAQKSGIVKKQKTYSHLLTSGITVGFGGSAGLESPIVVTGSAIGSNLARIFRFSYKDRILLLACGAAAGIASAFNAPITGVVFAAEVLIMGITTFEFIPIIIASVSGALCSQIILHQGVLLQFHLREDFNYENLPYYLVLGIITGLFSVYYIRVTHKIEDYFERFRTRWLLKACIAGISLAILFSIFPSLFGEGYESIRFLASGNAQALVDHSIFEDFIQSPWILLVFIGITVLFKVVATSLTLSGGGNGGNFAPTLFTGAYLGYILSKFINLLPLEKVPQSNFILVGMAGVLSGVMLAPLTGIFLIAEITGGYDLILPLMLVAAISFIIVRYFERYSLDTKKLALKGKIFTEDRERNILSRMKVKNIIETDFKKIDPEVTLRSLVDVVKRTNRNIIVVQNSDEEFFGFIDISKIKDLLFDEEVYDNIVVKDILVAPSVFIDYNDSMITAMSKFDACKLWQLPVFKSGKYSGFISKSSLLQFYRDELAKQAGLR